MKTKVMVAGAVIVATLQAASVSTAAAMQQMDKAPPAMHHATAGANISPAELTLRQNMRELWTDHVVWTREYIVAATADRPEAAAAAARLMKNQEDIGGAVAMYYGKEAGDKLTGLLKEHITIAVDLIKAAKMKNDSTMKAADAKWQKNGDDIATFLSSANPNWPKATVSEMMKTHLATTSKELNARLNQKWDEEVAAYDEVYDHILKMADGLSAGIVKQFPDKFR